MKVSELIRRLKGYEDFDIELTVHRLMSDEELKGSIYPCPYENIETDLEIDDIAHSDKIIALGCTIK